MEKKAELIRDSIFFADIAPDDVTEMMGCLGAHERSYNRGEFILPPGESDVPVCIMLKGVAYVMGEDYWGNRCILSRVGPGELFGEALACARLAKASVGVMAVEDCTVLHMQYAKIAFGCPKGCMRHRAVLSNMLSIFASKQISLAKKLNFLSKRTTQEKLLSYLSEEAARTGSDSFTIPFNRQELADFLSVERSAMSAEISKMRAKGLIACTRNHFTLLKPTENS